MPMAGRSRRSLRAIDYWYWPLSLPDRFMNAKIQRACHALALEDERDAFRPVLWDERYVKANDHLVPMDQGWAPPAAENGELAAIDRERMSQVWFVGVHSDVGGGYPQDGLAHFTLDWMIDRAKVYKLELLPERIQEELETSQSTGSTSSTTPGTGSLPTIATGRANSKISTSCHLTGCQ